MDLIYGKCVQTGILGFVIGSGFHLWQHIDNRIFGGPLTNVPPTSLPTSTVTAPSMSTAETPPTNQKSITLTHRNSGTMSSIPHTTISSSSSPSVDRLSWRHILRESCNEGIRTSKILVAATGAAGIVSFLQHGRYSDKLYRLQGDVLSTAAGVGMGVYMFIGPTTATVTNVVGSTSTILPASSLSTMLFNQRTGISFLAACFAGYISGSLKPSSPFSSP